MFLRLPDAQWLPGPRDLRAFSPSRLPLLVAEATNHVSRQRQEQETATAAT